MPKKNSGSGTRPSQPKPFTEKIVRNLPSDNAALYVLERYGAPQYTGIAKRGRLQERL